MAGSVVRIIDGKGGCCDCSQQTDCTCSSNNCSLQCQAIAGIADICGFPKFIQEDPPQAFYDKTISGAIGIGEGTSLAAEPCMASNPPNSWSASGVCQGDGGCLCAPFSFSAQFLPTGPGAPGTTIYAATFSCACNGHDVTSMVVMEGFSRIWANGDTHPITDGTFGDVHLDLALCTFSDCTNNPGSGTIRTGASPIPQFNDNWSASGSYDKSSCALTSSDTSARLYDNAYSFPSGGGTADGSPPGGLLDGPNYGGIAAQTTSSGTNRSTKGTQVCVANGYPPLGPNYAIGQGTVTETLTSESTADDAIARAVAGKDYAPVSSCQNGTSFVTPYTYESSNPFTFGFRKGQVRACVSGLTVGQSYQVTVGLYQRAVGTTNAFTPYMNIVLTITADATSDCTPYQDIPTIYGMETMAGSCSVVAL